MGYFLKLSWNQAQLRLDGIPYLFCLSLTFWICARYLPTGLSIPDVVVPCVQVHGRSLGLAAPAGLPVVLGTGEAAGLAGLLQFLQRPSNLACRRLSCSRSRRYSMRSGVWFLCRSYSSRSCLLASTSAGFGSVRCLGFPGVPAAVPFCGGFRAVLSLPFGERLLATRLRGALSSMKSCWKVILLEYCGGRSAALRVRTLCTLAEGNFLGHSFLSRFA